MISMKITLCGSARFESGFKLANERLSLAGHVVYSLAVYPSDKNGQKTWYTDDQKATLDRVHLEKILNSDAIYVIAPGGYIGESTKREIEYAKRHGKKVLCAYPLGDGAIRTCPFEGCHDPVTVPPCALCYE